MAFRTDVASLADFYGLVAGKVGLKRALPVDLPHGVMAQVRTDGQRDFVFVMNFTPEAQPVPLDGVAYTDVLTGDSVPGSLTLAPYGLAILARPAAMR